MGDMNFPDPNTTKEYDGWEWDGEKWAKWGSGGSGGDNTTSKTAIASGVMATGEMVVVNADGTVSVVKGSLTPGGDMPAETGEEVEFHGNRPRYTAAAYDANSGKIVVVDISEPDYFGAAISGEIVGDTIVFGTRVVFYSNRCSYSSVCFDQSSGKFVIAFGDSSDGTKGKAVAGEISGNTILFESPVEFESLIISFPSATYNPAVEKVIVAYNNVVGQDQIGKVVVGSIVNGTLSFGQSSSFDTRRPNLIQSAYDPISESTVIVYQARNNAKAGTAVVGKVANNSMTFGTPVEFDTDVVTYPSVAYDHASKKMVIAYCSEDSNKGRLVVCTVSGDTITFGDPVEFSDIIYSADLLVRSDPVRGKVVIFYTVEPSFQGTVIAGEVSGDSATFDDPLLFGDGTVSYHHFALTPQAKSSGFFMQEATTIKATEEPTVPAVRSQIL
jgi:hypothetical protein